MNERQLARKYLMTQPLPANFNPHAYLDAVSGNPDAWKQLMTKVSAANLTPGPVKQPGFFDRFANLGPKPTGTVPQRSLQDLTSSMGD